MIINKDRLIELLNHQDARVRNASVHALEKYFSGSYGVIEYLLKSIKRYPDDCLSLVAIVSPPLLSITRGCKLTSW